MKTNYFKVSLVILAIMITFVSCKQDNTTPSESSLPQSRVGLVMPVTGEMAPYGAEGIIAARIALRYAQQNAKHSKPVLLEEDSASKPDQANAAAANLVSRRNAIHVLVGEINSANTAAMVSQARTAGIPILAPTASSISLTSMSDRIFRIWPSDSYEATQMKEYIVSQGIQSVGVLYIQVPYGEEMAKHFEKVFQQSGGKIALEAYRKDVVNFKPLLQRLQAFDNLYIISYVDDAALILKQAYESKALTGHKFRFFGTSVLDSPKLIEKAGVAAEGVTFAVVQSGEGQDPLKREKFIEEYKKAYTEAQSDSALRQAANEPTFAAFHVYDAVSLAFTACDATVQNGTISGSAIISYFKEMPTYTGLTGDIRFDDKGDLAAERNVVFKQVKDGRIQPISE